MSSQCRQAKRSWCSSCSSSSGGGGGSAEGEEEEKAELEGVEEDE
jgi:hypothetical protein